MPLAEDPHTAGLVAVTRTVSVVVKVDVWQPIRGARLTVLIPEQVNEYEAGSEVGVTVNDPDPVVTVPLQAPPFVQGARLVTSQERVTDCPSVIFVLLRVSSTSGVKLPHPAQRVSG